MWDVFGRLARVDANGPQVVEAERRSDPQCEVVGRHVASGFNIGEGSLGASDRGGEGRLVQVPCPSEGFDRMPIVAHGSQYEACDRLLSTPPNIFQVGRVVLLGNGFRATPTHLRRSADGTKFADVCRKCGRTQPWAKTA